MPSSSRRRFLTGGIALDAARARGEKLADALAEGDEARELPRAGDTVRLETRAMACPWSVVLDPGPHDRVLHASEALDEVHRIEGMLTVYRDDSGVARLNREASQTPCAVTPELFAFLEQCRRLYDATNHAFDPAAQALILLWRDCRAAGRVPSDEEIETALQSCGMEHVRLERDENGSVVRDRSPEQADSPQIVRDGGPELREGEATGRVSFEVPGLGLNFGAIGKGYAIDRAAASLHRHEITNYLVHGGHSSLYASGEHDTQPGWPVGLKNPLFTDDSYLLLLLRDQALATSGSNIQFFRHSGKRYGHILDPRNGRPAEKLLSVSVVAPTAAEADALSTAFYVLGLEKAIECCDTHPEVGAILTAPPARGRKLSPLVCNLAREQVFPVSDEVDLQFTAAS